MGIALDIWGWSQFYNINIEWSFADMRFDYASIIITVLNYVATYRLIRYIYKAASVAACRLQFHQLVILIF